MLGEIWEERPRLPEPVDPARASRGGAVRREQVVEERDGGVRVEGGAVPQRCLPAGLEGHGQVLPHRLCYVGVQAAHPGDIVAEPLLGEDLWDAVLGHPRLVGYLYSISGSPCPDACLAASEDQVPPRTPVHEKDLKLSAVGWVKHRWHRMNKQDGFPSTVSVASAPYRQAVLRHLEHDAVRDAVRMPRSAVGQVEGTAPETAAPGLVTPGEDDRWFATSAGP
jgi:hypothetical protein